MSESVSPDQLRDLIEAYVAAYPARTGVRNIWRRPLLATALIDERFDSLPTMAAENHLRPRDLLASARTVIVFFIPFIQDLAARNSPGKFPCRDWGLAYVETNELIGRLSQHLQDHLASRGFASALTPATHNFDPVKLNSRWSHKHLGFLSGLGRFGRNAQLITPAGCTGRLGSLVTEADLDDSPVIETEEACLDKAGRECLECVKRCPVKALTADGLDRARCYTRLKTNRKSRPELAGLPETTHVCGKCVVMLPCSFTNPLAG